MQKRNINLDLIRCIAVLSVLSVHFFANTGYYAQILAGGTMYIATILRTTFMICVPLFLILSGYLMNKKEISLRYFVGISKVLIIYMLANAVILLFRVLYYKESFTLLSVLHSMTSFELYAWYIEMYVGLYLLIPFINLIYNNLNNKKDKTIFLSVMLLLTVAPSLLNSFGYTIVPDFWTGFYPITYYVIGAYLHEYHEDIKASCLQLFGLFILCIICGGTFTFMLCHNTPFIWGAWCDWGGFINTCSSTAVFLFMLKLNLEKTPQFLANIIQTISKVSLPLYLVSWIFDTLIYSVFNTHIIDFGAKIPFLPITVFLVFICSFIIACIINIVHHFLLQIVAKRKSL